MIDTNKFLNSDAIKSNLILSALYLAAYELLRDAIIDNIRNFFIIEYKDGKVIRDKQYDDEVIKVNKDLLYSSSLWLQHNGVITENEVEEIKNIRKHRNQIAHELPKVLSESDLNLNAGYFRRIRELLEKIEVWWIKNVDIQINTNFYSIEIDEKDILPSRVIALDHVISVALTDYLK